MGAIGATPSVWLDRFTANRGLEGRILAKLDYLNPGFSKKDRAALGIIDAAERDGTLSPGQTVVELTSGNMGTGLAIVCAIKGYPFIAVMSRGNSVERARMMKALGAEVVLVDQLPGSVPGRVSGGDLAEVEREAQRIASDFRAFRADQFALPGNAQAHFDTTGPELWEESGYTLTAFVDFAGSCGTYAGTIRALKSRDTAIRGYLVEPEGAAAIAGADVTSPDHPIQGGGYSMVEPALLKDVPVDGFLKVSGSEARETARSLAREEGIFGGFSGGANVSAAAHLLADDLKGATIGCLICDSGLKYLSTDLWQE